MIAKTLENPIIERKYQRTVLQPLFEKKVGTKTKWEKDWESELLRWR